MQIGDARVSTSEQRAGLEAQIRDLRAAGAERVFAEQISAVAKRDQLDDCLRFLREGDTLTTCRPDRLARSTADLLQIIADLEGRGVGLIVLSMGGQKLDTRTATGRMTLTILAAVAEFERNLMLERQRAGIARARAEKRYKGRQPTARAKAPEVIRMAESGLTREGIAEQLGIGLSSVYRALASARVSAPPQQAA